MGLVVPLVQVAFRAPRDGSAARSLPGYENAYEVSSTCGKRDGERCLPRDGATRRSHCQRDRARVVRERAVLEASMKKGAGRTRPLRPWLPPGPTFVGAVPAPRAGASETSHPRPRPETSSCVGPSDRSKSWINRESTRATLTRRSVSHGGGDGVYW